MFDTDPYELRMAGALEHFEAELRKVQTGRAQSSMLDSIKVEVYGTLTPLNQAANVTTPEPQLLQITPFDPSNITAITAAIRNDLTLGLNPSDDGRIIRVPVPPLTEERRKQIVKQTSERVEDARIAMRQIRQDALQDAKRQKDAKTLTEDDVRAVEKEIDHLMGEYQGKIDAAFRVKEKDILTL